MRQQTGSGIPGAAPGASASARPGHDLSRIQVHARAPVSLRPKLAVSAPGNVHEEEADRVSEQVIREPEPQATDTWFAGARVPAPVPSSGTSNTLRRRDERVQDGETGEVEAPPVVQEALAAPGRTLDQETRGFMEPRFGHDFGGVRVHDDARADAASASVGARAFTVGADIVFRRGEFAPHTPEGRKLLAHELAHVAQGPHGRPRLFRQTAVEPHYPTEEEQSKIEEIFSREFEQAEEAPAPTPGAPAAPVVRRGRSLNEAEREALANRLRRPYFDALASLDTGAAGSGGGALNEAEAFEVVTKAREEIFKRFGRYAVRQLTLTRDETTTGASRRAADQLLVVFRAAPGVVEATARTIATTHCQECLAGLAGLDDASRRAVIGALIAAAQQERSEQLQRVAAARVPGAFNRAESRVSLSRGSGKEFYHTVVHELIHALAHPAFTAAFSDEDYINEGFTEYFTRKVVGEGSTSYQTQYEKVVSARDAMKGPFLLATVGGEALEESMRMAYFRGRLDLIGWRPSGPEEERAVKAAEPSAKPWDPATARRYAEIYRTQAKAVQAASRNVLGMGLFFAKGSDDQTVAVRYARVIAQTEPYAKHRLLLEGQLLGSPVTNPRNALGASLGIAAEYQEPYFYAGGGVRFVGTAAQAGGADRLDASPFVGAGVRAWQTIRVGAEGFVLLPVTGQEVVYGAGVTLGVEFGK